MKNLRTLLIATLFFNSFVLFAQTPPRYCKAYITEAIGEGCHNVSDCESGLICFDVSIEIDEPGWFLKAYDVFMDYGFSDTIYSYASDSSCHHVDGVDINLDQLGIYRFLATSFELALEANTPTIIHNFCLKIVDYNKFDTTSITARSRLFGLQSNYALVAPGSQTTTNGRILSSEPYFVDERQRHNISDTIVYPDCLTADISITDTDLTDPRYSWSTGDTTPYLSALNSGQYFVTISEAGSDCQSVLSYFIENYEVEADFTHQSSALNVEFTDLTTGNPIDMTWDMGDGEIIQGSVSTYEYAQEGTYYVCLLAGNHCGEDQFCTYVTVTHKVSAEQKPKTGGVLTGGFIPSLAVEKSSYVDVHMYPNPTSGVFSINLTERRMVNSYQLVDMNGRNLISQNVNNETSTIKLDARQFSNGTYFIQILLENEIIVKPMVIMH